MKNLILFITFISVLFSNTLKSQEYFKFGKVEKEDFDLEAYREKYPEAEAVVIGDIGLIEFTLNQKSLNFEYNLTRTIRYMVLSEEGVDYGNISIPYFASDKRQDHIRSFRAYIHNLEADKVKRKRIRKRAGYVVDEDKYYKTLNYALPSIKPGTIFEVKYKLISERIERLPNWNFQLTIPVEYSELSLDLPSAFSYRMRMRGSQHPNNQSNSKSNFIAGYNQQYLQMAAIKYNWVARDIPAMKEEPYVDNIRNYLQTMTFELISVDFGGQSEPSHFTKSWSDVLNYLLDHSAYGDFLKESEAALYRHVDIETSGNFETDLNTALNEIRNKIRWNNSNNIVSYDDPETVFKNNSGNSAAINLLLYSQLRKMGIEAYPVLLSTVDNIKLISEQPVLSELNYIIVAAYSPDGDYVFLDATEPELPVGYVPLRALNGKGIILHEEKIKWLEIENAMSKQIISNYNLRITDEGNFEGEFEKKYYFYSKYLIKKEYLMEGDERFKNGFFNTTGVKIKDVEIIDSENPNEAFIVKGSMMLEGFAQIINNEVFFEPLLNGSKNKQIFKNNERKYPVEFFVPSASTTNITIDIPDNCQVISMPDNKNLFFGQNISYNYYNIKKDNSQIIVFTSEQIKTRTVHQDNYKGFTNYCNKIIDLNKQKVVLKFK